MTSGSQESAATDKALDLSTRRTPDQDRRSQTPDVIWPLPHPQETHLQADYDCSFPESEQYLPAILFENPFGLESRELQGSGSEPLIHPSEANPSLRYHTVTETATSETGQCTVKLRAYPATPATPASNPLEYGAPSIMDPRLQPSTSRSTYPYHFGDIHAGTQYGRHERRRRSKLRSERKMKTSRLPKCLICRDDYLCRRHALLDRPAPHHPSSSSHGMDVERTSMSTDHSASMYLPTDMTSDYSIYMPTPLDQLLTEAVIDPAPKDEKKDDKS